MTRGDLLKLAERVEAGIGNDYPLEQQIRAAAKYPPKPWRYTTSIDACVILMDNLLPGFWWRGGTCCVSSEVTVCPDHNNPEHRERLLRDFPPSIEHWDEGIEVELRPGSNDALCRAFLSAILRAYAATLENRDE